jgi:sporulation protein YlmC with PRC-barrel domain
MITKCFAATLLGSVLLTTAAMAQPTTTADRSNMNVSAHKEGEWRSSKLIGVDVYNDANEKIGDIEDLIVDKSGKIEHVILGVGGFLGMGEHYVAVSYEKLRWVNEAVRSGTTSPATSTPAGDNRPARPVRAADEKWYPDHVVLNATKDQLKSMPQFKY